MKEFCKKNVLFIIIIFASLLMEGYGFVLKEAGYTFPDNESRQPLIALGILELDDGIYPWNLKDGLITGDKQWAKTKISSQYNEKFEENGMAGASEYIFSDKDSIDEDGAKNADIKDDSDNDEKISYHYEIGPVDDSYFQDACFIGDSRMEGVYEYAEIEGATYYAKEAMTIYKLMDKRLSSTREVANVREGLTENKFGKIYIMVGLNELGIGDTEYFIKAYQEVLSEIMELQPDSVIIIQGIMHVTRRKDSRDRVFKNSIINERNEALKKLADNKKIFYIDINEVYDDENGNLRQDYSADDVHLYANKYDAWKEYYYTHGIIEVEDKQ